MLKNQWQPLRGCKTQSELMMTTWLDYYYEIHERRRRSLKLFYFVLCFDSESFCFFQSLNCIKSNQNQSSMHLNYLNFALIFSNCHFFNQSYSKLYNVVKYRNEVFSAEKIYLHNKLASSAVKRGFYRIRNMFRKTKSKSHEATASACLSRWSIVGGAERKSSGRI